MAKNRRLFPEKKYLRGGLAFVVGVDEAGRGPLAGPVAAGAVVLLDIGARDDSFARLLEEVDDSKKLGPQKREELSRILMNHEKIACAVSMVWPRLIDRINIFEASKLAMARAVFRVAQKIGASPERQMFCLVDGNFSIKIPFGQRSIIGGDAKVFSISAASIIAKTARDRVMEKLDKKYPAYGFARHKGYPTKEHLEALRRHGLSPAHRLSFGPCAVLQRDVIIKEE